MADDARPGDDQDEARDPEGDEALTSALPGKVERWRKRSATGAIMTGFAFGLREVFEPERKEPSITLETSGVPPTDLPVEAEFDGIVARRSVVKIRPWLLERTGGSEDPAAGAKAADAATADSGGATSAEDDAAASGRVDSPGDNPAGGSK